MRITDDIIESLRSEPWRWGPALCTYARDDGVEIWRSNVPIFDVFIYRPFEMRLPLIDRFRLWHAFRKWNREMPLLGYTKEQPQ